MRVALRAVEVPLLFDASLAVFAGLDAVLALAAGLAVAAEDLVVARLRVDLVGEGGVEVGTIATVAEVRRKGTGWRCVANLSEARVALEVGERVTAVGARTVSVDAQPIGLALLSAATIWTSRGRELTVVSTAVLVGTDIGGALCLVSKPMSLVSGRAAVSYSVGRSVRTE